MKNMWLVFTTFYKRALVYVPEKSYLCSVKQILIKKCSL